MSNHWKIAALLLALGGSLAGLAQAQTYRLPADTPRYIRAAIESLRPELPELRELVWVDEDGLIPIAH